MNYRNSPHLLPFAARPVSSSKGTPSKASPSDLACNASSQVETEPLAVSVLEPPKPTHLFQLSTPTARVVLDRSQESAEQGRGALATSTTPVRLREMHINASGQHEENPAKPKQDVVVLLHGLFATTRSMRKVATSVQAQGYRIENWGYPTFLKSIESNVENLLPKLHALESNSSIRAIHFVTHSLGGILARYALELSSFTKIKRLIMLAPPNAGSHLTRFSLGPFKRFLPVIGEISESPNSLPNRLSRPQGVEVGVIAASSDFIVHVANTMLPYQTDHCVVQASHFELPSHAEAIQKVLNFLDIGRFDPAATARPAAASRKTAA